MDPWIVAIEQLHGTWPVPDPAWPEEERHIVLMAEREELAQGDVDPLEREPRTAVIDDRLLVHLRTVGRCSVRVAAAGAGLTRSTCERALQRLRAAGLVHKDLDGYSAA